MVSNTEIILAQPFLAMTSAQKTERKALTKVLELGKDKRRNIDMYSWYVFATSHVHGAIYMERDAFGQPKERISKVKRNSSSY